MLLQELSTDTATSRSKYQYWVFIYWMWVKRLIMKGNPCLNKIPAEEDEAAVFFIWSADAGAAYAEAGVKWQVLGCQLVVLVGQWGKTRHLEKDS